MPRSCARCASVTACLIESWKTPGIEATGLLTSSPAVTNIGYTKSCGESRVSRTSPRRPAVRLVLLSLCCGNAISITLRRRIRGEEVRDRLDQPQDSVLVCLGVDLETALAGRLGRYGANARDPGLRQEPRRLLGAERSHEILHGGAGREGDAVYLARSQAQGQFLFALGGGNRLVGRWDDHLGAGLPEPVGQDLTRHLRAWDQDASFRELASVESCDEALGPVLFGNHVDPQPGPFYPFSGRGTDRRHLRLPRYGPKVEPMVTQPLQERLHAVHAG